MAIEKVNQNTFGSTVPTTFVLDVARLSDINVNSDDFKELLVRLYQNLNRMALVLNTKTSGYFPINQFVTGNQWFPTTAATSLTNALYRPETRIVINFGMLPNAGTKSVPHGINVTSQTVWVRIYGTATDPIGLTGIPILYASSVLANNIELNVDATNVNVTTAADYTAYTTTIIVLEFLTQA